MIYLLRYGQFSPADLEDEWAGHTKHYQKLDLLRWAERLDADGVNVAEIGSKKAFKNLAAFSRARRFVIEPYNGAAGAGPETVPPQLPYPIALFRCLVGPDSRIIPDEMFDVTFSISVLEHIGQRETGYDVTPAIPPPPVQEKLRDEFCAELFRMTKRGGVTVHSIDHAARNLTYVDNFIRAGFEPYAAGSGPSVEECLHDPDAVRQKSRWTDRTVPMPPDQFPYSSAFVCAFRKR